MNINREHLAGLELVRKQVSITSPLAAEQLDYLITQAQAAPVAEPVAYAVFADSGNVMCFSTVRDHHSLKALEAAGAAVVPLYTHPHDAELVELLWRVRRYVRIEDDDELLKRIDTHLSTLNHV